MIQASLALYTSLLSCPYSWLIYHQAIQLFFFSGVTKERFPTFVAHCAHTVWYVL